MRLIHWGYQLSPFQIIMLSFLLLIAIGTFALMLPVATKSGQSAPFLTALFTTVSAACVTGLTLENTALYWSGFGQLIILLLIQIGGLGVVTMAVAIVMASGRRIDLMQRSTMQEAIAAPQLGGIVRILRFILKFTLLVEGLGAAILFPVFARDYGWINGLWMAFFHSISAFCNAGFDLMGEHGGGSLMGYASDPWVNLTIMGLIVAGGLGFITWADIHWNGMRFSRYRLQSKIILLMTAGLIFVPATLFFFLEFQDFPEEVRLFQALFQSVTARTAGFNTVDINLLSESGRLLLVVLMLIGGAPGSTAGGIKSTTAFVLLTSAFASLRRKRDVTFFSRRIADETNEQALTIFLMYLLLFVGSSWLISVVDGFSLVDCMVETSSALGTVGLSIGLTEKLSAFSQLILIMLMYFGRVGALTMIYALNKRSIPVTGRLPQEKITVG
ncbi:TrkH family potassium uptake protein [Selenomonas ruminis]|uniref:Trk family potassium uptake protein n=1 Tax=Selenomonas ruminis TaxID=2593411 RepID=A0A5D6WBR2_9FIRM|nr:potassium transporter TrkG [Selenomonas sp. mPRGC5]TYZ24892.1 Trk family potassium uptake protein [Selenomonas sp. mPRGC5]